MSKQKEKELERAARLENHRQEAEDARRAYVTACNNWIRLGEEHKAIYDAAIAFDRASRPDWSEYEDELSDRVGNALKAYQDAQSEMHRSRWLLDRKSKVVARDESREAARIARAAERSAQKQQEPRAVARREKKAAEFKKAMDLMRERLADADDFYL